MEISFFRGHFKEDVKLCMYPSFVFTAPQYFPIYSPLKLQINVEGGASASHDFLRPLLFPGCGRPEGAWGTRSRMDGCIVQLHAVLFYYWVPKKATILTKTKHESLKYVYNTTIPSSTIATPRDNPF